jgi:hypothetical protein
VERGAKSLAAIVSIAIQTCAIILAANLVSFAARLRLAPAMKVAALLVFRR